MTDALLLSPHNDDSELFACWTLLRHHPHVIVVLRSWVQEYQHNFKVTAAERESETGSAMRILGCTWEQWPFFDSKEPDWERIETRLAAVISSGLYSRVFAPAVEEGGHEQHNRIGEIVERLCPDRATFYMTYRRDSSGARSKGVEVPYERKWIGLKHAALACYQSQICIASTYEHFMQPLHEFYAA